MTEAAALEELTRRVAALEARIAALETGGRSGGRRGGSGAGPAAAGELDASGWTAPYPVAQLEPADSWIELHEPSARPHLQRMLREVVEAEGPVTERLALDRIRRTWGLRRAGGRVQEAFDQAVRQLVSRSLVERDADALRVPGRELGLVRVPDGDDEATRRGAEDVPLVELALALREAATALGAVEVDDLTMRVAKLFGWTRRGGAIQERLDAALDLAVQRGELAVDGSRVRALARA
jgi:hypothetical protein